MRIGSNIIGPGQPCFIIAEAGVNHNGDIKLAKKLIDCAVDSLADAVKFQTFKADRLVSEGAPKADYQARTTGDSESQLQMLRRLELSELAHRELMRYCRKRGIIFLSTPFDESCADFLSRLGVSAFKIPSGEITNLQFLRHLAVFGRPMILSTGMATLGEVESAIRTVLAAGNSDLALLHCVSNYPADPKDVNLRAMQTMAAAFGLPVGFSDHTMGSEVAIAAAALGACIIDKHFTLDRALPGPDHQASLEPQELSVMVRSIRNVEAALGHGRKEPVPGEADTAAVTRKSLVAARDIPRGTLLTEAMLALKRPGTGLPPATLSYVLGRKTRHRIIAGTLIGFEMLS